MEVTSMGQNPREDPLVRGARREAVAVALAAVATGPSASWGALAMLCGVVVASVWLGTLASRASAGGRFVTAYFLGSRGLGSWTLALTATVQSGGTFMGFPALVYSNGWVVA